MGNIVKKEGLEMPKTTRREAIRNGAMMGVGIVSSAVIKPDNAKASYPIENETCKWEKDYTFGHTILFMEEYHQGTMEILGRLRGEIDHVGELSSRAASVIRNGGTVWTSMNVGHMPGSEQKETRRGSPGIMKDSAEFDTFKKGDMVFTNYCSKAVLAARERGVYVVSVTVNYIDNEFRPAGFANPNEDNLMLKDVSNEILHSHVPYYQGLVHAPEIPEFTLCPSSTTGLGALHWMLNAELANKVADKGAKEVDKSAEYLNILTERVEKVKSHQCRIREVAVTMARRVRDGGRWFVKCIEHYGFQDEMYGVASGPMIVNCGDWDATKEKNIMLINAISPAYPDEVKLATEKQLEGAYVIGVGPCSLDGKVPYNRLIDIADAGFNNFSPESGGVININKRKDTICPTSGIVGNIIQQMICAQWTDEMVRRGSIPYYWMGVFQNGGRPYNKGIRPFFEIQGF